VNGAGGDEGMNPGPLGVLNGLPGGSNVLLVAAGEAADDGDVAVVFHGVADRLGDHFHGLKVVLGGGGEAGLDDVNAQLGELPRHVQLLLRGHGGARGLLAVAESRVENADIGRVRNEVGDVRRTPPRRRRMRRRRFRLGAGNGESGFGAERRA